MNTRGKFWLSHALSLGARSWNYLRAQRPTHAIFALWVIACVVADYFNLANFIDRQVVSPTEFRVRRWLGKSPQVSPKLKIFAFDDLAIKLLGEAYFPHELWHPLIEGLNQARPRVILSSTQFSFEKKGLPESDIQRIANLPNLSTPIVATAIFSPHLLPYRSSLLGRAAWRSTPGLEGVLSYDYGQAYAYGPEGAFRAAFRQLGHTYQPWGDRFAPIIKLQKDQVAPHLGLHGAHDWQVKEGDLYLGGRKIPIDRHGLSLVNFLDPDQLRTHIKTIVSLFPKINSGRIRDIIQPEDVVLIIGSFGTGASSFLGSPLGSLPNAYFLASIVNSALTGEWLGTYEFGWWMVCISALLGYALGWRVSTKIYLPILLAIILGFGTVDLLSFTFLSAKIIVLMPMLTLLGSSALSFNARLRDEQRRKLAMELEQNTAAILQRDFLPAPQLAADGFELLCYYQAAKAVGGDWYSYTIAEDRWLFLHVADVTGHGMPAALCASFAKGSIDAIHRTLGSFSPHDPPLEKVHERLNDILNREGSDRLLITAISIAIDLVDGKLWHVNSGHPPGVVIDANFEKVSHLRAAGTPILGLAAEFTPTSPQCLPIHPGDYVVLYTDGASPAIKKLVRNVTHARTRKVTRAVDLNTPQAMLDHVLQLNTEKMPKELVGTDDVTLVVIQFKGRGRKSETPGTSLSKKVPA